MVHSPLHTIISTDSVMSDLMLLATCVEPLSKRKRLLAPLLLFGETIGYKKSWLLLDAG